MYNERDDQLYIRANPSEEPLEFLLAEQPLEMIRANIITKDEIRATVETGRQDTPNLYAKLFSMQGYSIAMNVFVQIDGFLRIVENVEKLYF